MVRGPGKTDPKEERVFGKIQKEDFAVKRKRFAVEQIVGILKDAEGGIPVADLLRIRSDGNLYQRGSTRVGLSPALFKSGPGARLSLSW